MAGGPGASLRGARCRRERPVRYHGQRRRWLLVSTVGDLARRRGSDVKIRSRWRSDTARRPPRQPEFSCPPGIGQPLHAAGSRQQRQVDAQHRVALRVVDQYTARRQVEFARPARLRRPSVAPGRSTTTTAGRRAPRSPDRSSARLYRRRSRSAACQTGGVALDQQRIHGAVRRILDLGERHRSRADEVAGTARLNMQVAERTA